ncbi:MAG: HAMP domain-containing protein [Clostridia bacterium]|nr:HAMP domain-containing protein [Clostridia bacterium]
MIAKYIILSPFLLISFIISKITMYIRMSLSFKITFIFSLVFILFSFVYHLLIGALATHFTISNYINYTEGLFISAVVSTLFGLFIMISIGVKVAKKVLAPIEQMTEDIKEISSNSLDKRLNVSTAKDELKDLAIAFNGMLDELHEMYDKQSMFVSDASHELRTPIAVIQGYSSMLDRWGKNDEAVLSESLSAIKTEAENMKALVEKLLFLARADKNRIVLDKEFFDIAALMNDILRETEMIAPNHTIRGELHFDGQLFGDSNSIKQALRVFIDNSIKYTPENGNILIALNKAENHVIISIEDTGIGIPKDDVPHIFDRFYRADKSRTKETGGNGLGLSIAKWILDQHHCQVFVDSTVDVGTKITILFKYL